MDKPIFSSPIVSAEWLRENLTHPDLILLYGSLQNPMSVSEKSEEISIIPNALFFDLENYFSDLTNDLPHMLPSAEQFTIHAQNLGINENSIIIVYDSKGVYSSPRIYWMFKAMGHSKTAILNGGLPAWKALGLPATDNYKLPPSGKSKFERKGNFVARPQANYFVTKEDVQDAIERSSSFIIDARSEDRFFGKVDEPRAGLRRGNIPTSINIPFTHVLKDNVFPSKEEIESLFSFCPTKDQAMIFSCGSGVTACIDALAAQLAGFSNLKVYDGSWSEWGKSPA
jgi:thiosulfate/3-mercaptopyruvate sulfurtransferase